VQIGFLAEMAGGDEDAVGADANPGGASPGRGQERVG